MPHDKKGRLVEEGDFLRVKTYNRARAVVGRVIKVNEAVSCNAEVVWPGLGGIDRDYCGTADGELVLKADGSEPAAEPEAGRARVGAMALVAALVALALPVLARADSAPPPEPACGTVLAPKACASFTSGMVSVVTRGERREYATVGGAIEAPLGAGINAFAHVDVFGIQDGESADAGAPRTFRVVKLDAGVGRSVGAFLFSARGGVTYSIEGKVGAPLDPRMFDGQLEASLQLEGGGHLALRGGHDGAVGGWAAAADIEIPIEHAPSIVARYQLPFARDPIGRLPWAATLGARVNVKSFRLKF